MQEKSDTEKTLGYKSKVTYLRQEDEKKKKTK